MASSCYRPKADIAFGPPLRNAWSQQAELSTQIPLIPARDLKPIEMSFVAADSSKASYKEPPNLGAKTRKIETTESLR